MKAKLEFTDTFGGEANYSWVRRTEIEGAGIADIVRKAKRWAGISGSVCLREQHGDLIALRPSGAAVVLFIETDE